MATKKSSSPVSPIVLSNGKIGTLPPRKRARTQEEKEQRRIERIIRNRRAAHASREKKRRHVEQLEKYAKQLEKCLAEFMDTQSDLLNVQKQLTDKLQDSDIDFSEVDTEIKPVLPVDRPDGLDLDTSSRPIKRQRSSSLPKLKKEDEDFLSGGASDEIPSPPFERTGEPSTPDDSLDQFEMDLMQQKQQRKLQPERLHREQLQQQQMRQQQVQQPGILSPPPSTSPAKFRLDDSQILKKEYSSLFDEDIFMPDESTEAREGMAQGNSLKLFDQPAVASEDIVPEMSTEFYGQSQNVFRTDDMEYLDCLNDVHHSAVMMSP